MPKINHKLQPTSQPSEIEPPTIKTHSSKLTLTSCLFCLLGHSSTRLPTLGGLWPQLGWCRVTAAGDEAPCDQRSPTGGARLRSRAAARLPRGVPTLGGPQALDRAVRLAGRRERGDGGWGGVVRFFDVF